MRTKISNGSAKAMTLIEVIVVTVVVFILALIFLPALTPGPPRASRVNCVSNLKQVGLALRMWSGDHHEEKFPWQVPAQTNGTMEFAESPQVFRHFAILSNELSSPKVLACTSDERKSKISNWSEFNDTHLSYFIGLDANENFADTILTGDRNITGGVIASNGIMRFGSTNLAGWGQDMHKNRRQHRPCRRQRLSDNGKYSAQTDSIGVASHNRGRAPLLGSQTKLKPMPLKSLFRPALLPFLRVRGSSTQHSRRSGAAPSRLSQRRAGGRMRRLSA